MKYPLKWYHELGRQFVCWCIGHKWKSSSRHRENYKEIEAMEYMDIPYALRQEQPYYTYSGGWHFRCTRCRLHTRDWPYNPVSLELWRAIKNSWFDIKWAWTWYRTETKRTPKDFAFTVLDCVLAFPHQLAMYLFCESRYFPRIVAEWIFDAKDWANSNFTEKEQL